MTSTHEIHRRALAAAIAVVGRHRHRAGVAAMGAILSGSLACVPKAGEGTQTVSEATSDDSEATTDNSNTTTDDTALSDATGMAGTDDTDTMTDTMTGTMTGTGSGSSDSSDSSSTSSSTGDTGDSSTGEGTDSTSDGTSSSSSSTGDDTGLSDCKNGDGETDWECCEAQDWQPAEHCTPWGPPAPPRFVQRAPLPRLV